MAQEIGAAQLARLRAMIDKGEGWRFYSWRSWRGSESRPGVRDKVIKLDHSTCYYCGRPLRPGAAIVHHVAHLEDAPELALSIYAPDGSRQLVTVCKDCHEAAHPEALAAELRQPAESVTAERWD